MINHKLVTGLIMEYIRLNIMGSQRSIYLTYSTLFARGQQRCGCWLPILWHVVVVKACVEWKKRATSDSSMVTGLSSTSARSQTLNASSRGLWTNRQIDSNLGCRAVKLAISYSLYYIFSRPVSILLSSAALCRSPVCVSLSVCLSEVMSACRSLFVLLCWR